MNKLNKGKKFGIFAISLASISLIGIGFSSWIINTTNTATATSIRVTVADTKDVSITISDAAVSNDNNSVKFDANYSNHTSASLLTCNNSDSEDLSFAITYKVKVGYSASTWEIKAAIDDTSSGTNGNFTTAVTSKYIVLPTTLGLKTSSTDDSKTCFSSSDTSSTSAPLIVTTENTGDEGTKTYSVTQTFTFSWGEAFANMNPVGVTNSDSIYYSESTSAATLDTLTANTKGLKNSNLNSFNVILSVGNVTIAQ